MTQLGTILDLVEFKAHFKKISMTVPLAKLANGHLAVSRFPRSADTWGRRAGGKRATSPGSTQAAILSCLQKFRKERTLFTCPTAIRARNLKPARHHITMPSMHGGTTKIQSQTPRAPRCSVVVEPTSSYLREHDSARPAMSAPMASRGDEVDEATADGRDEPRKLGVARPPPRGRDTDVEHMCDHHETEGGKTAIEQVRQLCEVVRAEVEVRQQEREVASRRPVLGTLLEGFIAVIVAYLLGQRSTSQVQGEAGRSHDQPTAGEGEADLGTGNAFSRFELGRTDTPSAQGLPRAGDVRHRRRNGCSETGTDLAFWAPPRHQGA